jgi:hypothetical protein
MQFESLKEASYHGWHAESEAAAGSGERYPGFLISECFRMWRRLPSGVDLRVPKNLRLLLRVTHDPASE